MVLVDTSVWVDYFRKGNIHLEYLLEHGSVHMHAFIIGELACGHLPERKDTLYFLHSLPRIINVHDDEALFFLERHHLAGKGVGFADIHLLSALALQSHIKLWTYDRKLHSVAAAMNLNYVANALVNIHIEPDFDELPDDIARLFGMKH